VFSKFVNRQPQNKKQNPNEPFGYDNKLYYICTQFYNK
jgi:hypothetical protein